jgi:hypothetical protein
MPLYDETQLTNPQILVETPPPYERPDPPDQEYLEGRWYCRQGVNGVTTDDCGLSQQAWAVAGNRVQKAVFLVRQVTEDKDKTASDEKSPFCVLDNPLMYGDPNLNDGCFPTDNMDDHNKILSLTPVPATLSAISTPYLSGCYFAEHNKLEGKPAPRRLLIAYSWDDSTYTDEEPGPSRAFTGADGFVNVKTQPCTETKPTKLRLFPTADEAKTNVPDYAWNEDSLNAFVLFLGVYPGTKAGLPLTGGDQAANQKNPPGWEVKIEFGDMTVLLREGAADLTVQMAHSETSKEVHLTMDVARLTTPSTKGRPPYGLVFIPVYNGILIGDRLPGDTGFQESLQYVVKDGTKNILSEISRWFDEHTAASPPRFGPEMVNLDEVDGIVIDYFDLQGVEVGKSLSVTWTRCGGVVRFAPLYFVPGVRTHFLMQGERNATSTEETDACDGSTSVFEGLTEVPRFRVLPVYRTHASAEAEVRSALLNVTVSRNPTWMVSQEIVQSPVGLRRPIETWGFILYGTQPPLLDTYRTDEGSLTDFDVPQEKILTTRVSRTLEGQQGEILWDLYDPTTGLSARPPQNVGAIRISAVGGQDTQPGVIFTGIGVGNSEDDTQDSNIIKIPVYGRQYKLTDDNGGLRLLNSPFFDGYQIRDVLQWLCDYAGIPFVSYASDYRLPTGSIMDPKYNYPSNTTVWDAIQATVKDSAGVVFFDRFGVLNHYDIGQTSGVNWTYTAAQVQGYSDQPDFSSLFNSIVVLGLVVNGPFDPKDVMLNGYPRNDAVQLRGVSFRLATTPEFPWDKMALYVIPGTLSVPDFQMAAARIAFGLTRPRGSAHVTIPGNADIELLDTFNNAYVITEVTHSVVVGPGAQKVWSTSLSLELRVEMLPPPDSEGVGAEGSPAGDRLPTQGVDARSGVGTRTTPDATPPTPLPWGGGG